MTRWMHPPELLRTRERDQFDPVVEGGRYGLPRELALAIWERVCADATDSAGRQDEGQARRQFHELAPRIAARGGRISPDVGRMTRVGIELDGAMPFASGADELRPRTPGRETLIAVEARRWAHRLGEPVFDGAKEAKEAEKADEAMEQHDPPGASEVAQAMAAFQTSLRADQETLFEASDSGRIGRLFGFGPSKIDEGLTSFDATAATKAVRQGDKAHSALTPTVLSPWGHDQSTDDPQRPRYIEKLSVPEPEPLVANADSPRLAFDDYRVLWLQETLQRLGPEHQLRQEIIAATATGERSVTDGAMPRSALLPGATTLNDHALWHTPEHRAITLYRCTLNSGTANVHDPAIEAALRLRGSGEPLEKEVRREMEHELGVSLAGVRIHTNTVAAKAAHAVDADAFTVGEDIFFAEGKFAPYTHAGRKLLVHELVHVAQARHGDMRSTGDGLLMTQPSEPHEQEASEIAKRVASSANRTPLTGQNADSTDLISLRSIISDLTCDYIKTGQLSHQNGTGLKDTLNQSMHSIVVLHRNINQKFSLGLPSLKLRRELKLKLPEGPFDALAFWLLHPPTSWSRNSASWKLTSEWLSHLLGGEQLASFGAIFWKYHRFQGYAKDVNGAVDMDSLGDSQIYRFLDNSFTAAIHAGMDKGLQQGILTLMGTHNIPEFKAGEPPQRQLPTTIITLPEIKFP